MDTIGMINEVTVNGRNYRLPRRPTVVVCIDGSEPGYIEAAVAAGRAPWLARVLTEGTSLIADCVIPSFTNPNNLSIVTGRPPAVHGISGNYLLDPETGKEVMMNDPRFLRVETLFTAFSPSRAPFTASSPATRATALLTPEAIPAWLESTAASTVAVTGATTKVRPRPKTITAGST